jgi:pyruvate dehydrogenase E2 component (dihydrolipoamide acetyltransferase)
MAEEFFIPKLGQTVEQVTLVKWLVEDGAKVTQGQEICEVETDKAIFPVESPAKGYIHIGPFTEGQVLPVLTVVAMIGKQEETFGEKVAGDQGSGVGEETLVESQKSKFATPQSEIKNQKSEILVSPRARKLAAEKGVDLSQVTPTGYEGIRIAERDVVAYLAQQPKALEQPKATPVAQRMAADTGVDLRSVTGSGPGGKIVKDDVARAAAPITEHASRTTPSDDVVQRIPLKGVRAIIAERMAASIHTGARVTLFAEADATELVAARARLKERVEKTWGFAPSYNDLLVKIVAAALRQFPYMNARFASNAQGELEAIEILRPIHIGQAVDTERGLLVPVIKNADAKNLRQLGEEFRALAEKARVGRSLPDDLTGGTFTITNLGMYEVDYFTPVINLPEAAILGVGRIAPKVVPFNGQATIRQMTTLSLAFDHRLVDGAPAAKFLQAIRQMVEEPYLLLAS